MFVMSVSILNNSILFSMFELVGLDPKHATNTFLRDNLAIWKISA